MSQKTINQYDEVLAGCRDLMIKKNHDYGEAWRRMRLTSLMDVINNKVDRIKQMEDLHLIGKQPMASEGIREEYRDILNYCAFAIIKIDEAAEDDTVEKIEATLQAINTLRNEQSER